MGEVRPTLAVVVGGALQAAGMVVNRWLLLCRAIDLAPGTSCEAGRADPSLFRPPAALSPSLMRVPQQSQCCTVLSLLCAEVTGRKVRMDVWETSSEQFQFDITNLPVEAKRKLGSPEVFDQ